MKKALIVTYYAGANYGAYWQAYALGQYITKCGYEVEYLKDPQMEKNLCEYKDDHEKILKAIIKQSINTTFRLTERTKGYDLAIFGSDEIWSRAAAMDNEKNVYWGKGIEANVMISYAPSAKDAGWKRLIFKRNNIKSLNAISVRDTMTYNTLVKDLKIKNVSLVLDPTFLIDYKDVVSERIVKGHYCLVYSYGLSEEQIYWIKEHAKKRKNKIVVIGFYAPWADYNKPVKPSEWLSLFKYADYVCTTTFHGTVFSVIFKKDFSLIGCNIKARDLLKLFGVNLNSEIITVKNQDYSIIDYNAETLLGMSLSYLNYNVNACIPVLFESKSCCFGCAACYSACSSNAIIMAKDSEGFLYPYINATNCVGCRKCILSCPYHKRMRGKKPND